MVNTLGGLTATVIAFVVLGIVIGIAGNVMTEIQKTQCDGTQDGDICVRCPLAYVTYNSTGETCYNSTLGPSNGVNNNHTAYLGQQSRDFNVSSKGLSGVKTFSDWLPTIAVILVSALVIGVIASYFVFKRES